MTTTLEGQAVECSDTAQAAPAPSPKRRLIDSVGRVIDRLRLSVTSACDLRCMYCRPVEKNARVHACGDLSDQQRLDLVLFLYDRYGLTQVRLTGGEPLLYPLLSGLIESIRRHCPDITIAVTTNGRLLSRQAASLRQAGLDQLNVSVDSLDEPCYRLITGGRLADVLEGLDAACHAGFPEPKINTVVLRGINDLEVVDLTRWALARGAEIRFLETMPIGPAGESNREKLVSAAEVRRRLESVFTLMPIASAPGSTATRYRATADGVSGIIGTIAPVTEPFCHSCRRIRITADGRLYPCLLDSMSVDMRTAWRHGQLDRDAISEMLGAAVRSKRERGSVQRVAMVQLGG